MSLFEVLALAVLLCVPGYAWWVRGRAYAVFGLIILLIALPGAVVMHGRFLAWVPPAVAPWVHWAFCYGVATAGVHMAGLVRARLRSWPFRWGISIPGMTFVAAGALSGVWLLALLPIRATFLLLGWDGALAASRWLDLVPFVVAGVSVLTSMRMVEEVVQVTLGTSGPPEVTRLPVERYRHGRGAPAASRRLRIVQITDTHLGPWQPVRLLQRRIADLVAQDPDLVLLTGDFLTMEGIGTPGALETALQPLRALRGRCFAIFGNHDHESPHEVMSALVANDVEVLLDAEAIVETAVGAVQLVGADHAFQDAREHVQRLLARFPRREDHLRLLMLHDPSRFRHVPKGDVDLTLSGHTHGGQLGLVSFGFDWTVLAKTRYPDHGLFGHGSNRLYVHRGTGFYGFPLRIGVPGELSLLELVLE
jgi:predicted MPP superfamily phosphohydrolase